MKQTKKKPRYFLTGDNFFLNLRPVASAVDENVEVLSSEGAANETRLDCAKVVDIDSFRC